jgi:TetR/AcrR family tetracycline transcriptional repressor
MADFDQVSLSRERLVNAAFLQLEKDGLDGLSMRRLAARLRVQAPALYWHISGKSELLGMMAGDIYAKAYAAVPATANWQEWLKLLGHALRASFGSHRDGARLCSVASPAAPSDPAEHARRISAPLVNLGLPEDQALAFQATVISYTLGWAASEANGSMRDFLQRMMNFDATFATGLEALVSGLEARHRSI